MMLPRAPEALRVISIPRTAVATVGNRSTTRRSGHQSTGITAPMQSTAKSTMTLAQRLPNLRTTDIPSMAVVTPGDRNTTRIAGSQNTDLTIRML